MGPGGPPGGATHPGGPHGLKWGGEPAHSGLVRPPWAPLRLGLETLGWGAPPLALGALHPPWPPPPWEIPSPRAGAPQGAYIKEGGGRAAAPQVLAPPSPLLHLSLSQKLGEALLRSLLHPSPRRRAAGSSSTSPFPLLDQEGGDVIRSVRVLNAEVPSIRR